MTHIDDGSGEGFNGVDGDEGDWACPGAGFELWPPDPWCLERTTPRTIAEIMRRSRRNPMIQHQILLFLRPSGPGRPKQPFFGTQPRPLQRPPARFTIFSSFSCRSLFRSILPSLPSLRSPCDASAECAGNGSVNPCSREGESTLIQFLFPEGISFIVR